MVEMEVVQKAPKVICRCDSYHSSFAKEVLTTYVVCVFVVLFIGKIQRELTKSAQSGSEWYDRLHTPSFLRVHHASAHFGVNPGLHARVSGSQTLYTHCDKAHPIKSHSTIPLSSSFLLSPPLSSPPFPFPSLHPAPADDTRLVEAQEALLKRQVENEDLKQQIEFLNSVISDLQVGCSVQLRWQYSQMPCCPLPVRLMLSNYCLACYRSASWKPLKCLPWGSTLRTVLTAGGPDITCTQCMYCMGNTTLSTVLYVHYSLLCCAVWVPSITSLVHQLLHGCLGQQD